MASDQVEFGGYELDLYAYRLRRAGRTLKLERIPMELLLLLVEGRGNLVAREEIIARLWGSDVFLDTDNAVNTAIRKIRMVLRDDPDKPRFIQTVTGKGYRFIAKVTEIEQLPGIQPGNMIPLAADASHLPASASEPVSMEAPVSHPPQEEPAQTAANTTRQPSVWKGGHWKILAPVAATAGLALILTTYFLLRRNHQLTDQDTVVLADFTNTTGDPVFSGTLRQGLAIQLEQSPFLKIMDDEQVQQDLRLMGLATSSRITNQIAHDICMRDGASATINGSIESLGKNYVIALQGTNCQSGTTLAREQVQAADKEHVLNALGAAATALRGKLGESLNSIQHLNRPLEQATTPSLEALQNYSAGYSAMNQGQFLASVPSFERAIALDPKFAMAYFMLGIAFQNAGDSERSREYTQKAFALIDQVSEFERDLITGSYYSNDGQSDKAVDAFRLGIRNYPRFWGFRNDLSYEYLELGQCEEALKEGQIASSLEANVEPPYRRQLDAYMCLDRLPEAKHLSETLRGRSLGGARIHQRFLEIAYIEDDAAGAAREIEWFAGKPTEYLSFGLQAAYQNVLGRRRESSKLYQRAAESALRQGFRNVAAELEEADARADALSGNCQAVLQSGRSPLALAMCGDVSLAEKQAAETSKLFPNGILLNAVHLPAIRTAVALNQNQPAKAVELLASASPYERAYAEATYLRGLAYLQLRDGAKAAAEFQKILDHKGANWGCAWQHPYWAQFYSLSYLGLARSFALAGDPANAVKDYQDFLSRWKAADPEIPILKQAKAEYAKVH